jgi:hypothetical protein
MYNNKRSPEAKEKRATKKTLRKQANDFIRENSFKDLDNGETINTLLPSQVQSYLLVANGVELKIIKSQIFGSLVSPREGCVVQAAQGLVLENGLTY